MQQNSNEPQTKPHIARPGDLARGGISGNIQGSVIFSLFSSKRTRRVFMRLRTKINTYLNKLYDTGQMLNYLITRKAN